MTRIQGKECRPLSSLAEQDRDEQMSLGSYAETSESSDVINDVGDQAPAHWSMVKGVLREVLETVVFTLIIFLLIQTFVRNFRVVGTSMEPNLHNGQYLVIDKISYRLGTPQRGDVVVFEPPMRPGEDYVKRIIALSGEVVEIERGQVFVNGNPLDEPYVVRPGSYSMDARRVGDEELFVLGDNRNSSSDSHSWGMLPEGNIVGRAWVSYWPPSRWGVITRSAPTENTTLSKWAGDTFGR
jgi:signal peptidase I